MRRSPGAAGRRTGLVAALAAGGVALAACAPASGSASGSVSAPAAAPAAASAPVAAPAPSSTPAATSKADPPVVPPEEVLPARSGSGRRVVYSIERQRVWLVEGSDEVASTYLVSGRPNQPDPGTYEVYSKSRHARSSVSPVTMEYMVRFTYGERTGTPVGFHDIPRFANGQLEQTVAQLGQPLSAGCIRQKSSDAKRLWSFAPLGTKVVVTA